MNGKEQSEDGEPKEGSATSITSRSYWDYCVPPRKTNGQNALDTAHVGGRCGMNLTAYMK